MSPNAPRTSDSGERYSRKVFVGGLPPDIDEGKLCFPIIKLNSLYFVAFNILNKTQKQLAHESQNCCCFFFVGEGAQWTNFIQKRTMKFCQYCSGIAKQALKTLICLYWLLGVRDQKGYQFLHAPTLFAISLCKLRTKEVFLVHLKYIWIILFIKQNRLL